MKKNIKIVITIAVAVILIGVGSLLIFKGFFQNKVANEFDNESIVVEENAGLLKEEADSGSSTSVEVENEDATLQSGNDNKNQKEDNGTDKDGQINNNSINDDEDNSKSSSNVTDEVNSKDLEAQYKKIVESGKPSTIVFSYDADCCEKTRIFFDDYNKKVFALMEENKDKFDTLFINTGILDKKDMDTALDIASKNEVLTIPSILILDSAGKAYEVIGGQFEESLVKNILDGMEK